MSALRNVAMTLLMVVIAHDGLRSSGAAASGVSQQGLVGTEWKAVELAGLSVSTLSGNRRPHLVFDTGGRLSGSDGCNRITGSYTIKGEEVTFSQVAATRMACPDTAEVERRVHSALSGTSHWKIVGNRLQFFGATGKPLAVFERGTPAAPTGSVSALRGTTWQLVRFHGGDGRTVTPDDPAKYTLDFGNDGRVAARVDCNRGTGTWKATGNQLELGPLALTFAKCPEGSLHDQIVKQWTFIRSFVIRGGHLFLSLMADGGVFEFAPRE